ncbi:hypothetical protein [Nitrosopumilus cobalaminigenes]|nr:hypothetical protein [Nitrosopumilus cobalaminigenes]
MGYSLLSTFPETDEKIMDEDNGLFDNLNLECSSETIYNSEPDLCE